MTPAQTDAAVRANQWCIAAVDQAIGRLATEVGRMDAIDLAAPWTPSDLTRRARVSALIQWLDDDDPHGDTRDGRDLAAALVRAWATRRDSCTDPSLSNLHATVLDVLAAVHNVRVALNAGIHEHDLHARPPRPHDLTSRHIGLS